MADIVPESSEAHIPRDSALRHFLTETRAGKSVVGLVALSGGLVACSESQESQSVEFVQPVVVTSPVTESVPAENNPTTTEVVEGSETLYPVNAPPIELAGNAVTDKEKTEGEVNWDRRLYVYTDNYRGNINKIMKGEIGVVDPTNPLSILEYTQLERLYATCTGDVDKIYDIYLAGEGSENGEMGNDLQVIHDRQVRAGEEHYDWETYCFDWGYAYSARTAQNIAWSDDGLTVSLDIEQADNEAKTRVPVRIEHRFIDGDWVISGKTLLEP